MQTCAEVTEALRIKEIRAPDEECALCRAGSVACAGREVVAAVLTHRGTLATLRRSPFVGSDCGLWHCITGYRPPGACPLAQAVTEIAEECGLSAAALTLRRRQELIEKGARGEAWRIHTFHFETDTAEIRLNWEHDALEWTTLKGLAHLPTVPWFVRVLEVLGITTSDPRTCESQATRYAVQEAGVP